ncbi:MAG TPA: aspartyl protease family protein [Chitinophagaceae bacterium]
MQSFQSKYSLINLLLVFACILPMTDAIGREINKKPVVLPTLDVAIELKAESTTADSTTFTVTFSRVGNLILVQGRADTIAGNFILDTGCPHLVLNLTYFRHYNTTHDHQADNAGMTGSVSGVTQATVRSFSFGTMNYYRIEADLVNLGHIENRKGVKILGLLGMRFLAQFEMIIDYENNLIYFHKINRKGNGYRHPLLTDTSTYRIIPFELIDDRIILKTEMAGKKIRLIIDSGSETNILDSRLPDKVFEKVAITGRIMITGVGNRQIEALQGNLRDIMIGNEAIVSMPIVVTNLEKTCFSYSGCVDGILGFDFLSLQKIGFNFVTRKMYIWK